MCGAQFGLQFYHFVADLGCEFFGGPLAPGGGEDGVAVDDADGVRAWEFGGAGPGFEGAVDDYWDDRDVGFAAIEDQDHAGGDWADDAVGGAGAFGEDVDHVAFVQAFDGGADGPQVGFAAFDGEGVEEFAEVLEEPAAEEGVAGHVVDLAVGGEADEPGVEEGLVIGDQQDAASAGQAGLATDVQAEEQHR